MIRLVYDEFTVSMYGHVFVLKLYLRSLLIDTFGLQCIHNIHVWIRFGLKLNLRSPLLDMFDLHWSRSIHLRIWLALSFHYRILVLIH